MRHPISIDSWMKRTDAIPVLDVRTPAEFAHGRMPGAFNLPLFTNEERVKVGTTYKQVGREAAILLGFDLVGPKWSEFIREALKMAPDKKVGVHCWRGGMRSGAMGWALDLYGFEVYLIEGGYKRYRKWVHQQFARDWKLMLIGGMTGSGKTKTLHALRDMGEQIIDLEELAQHQGSTYGTLNRLVQPTQEQFENNFAEALHTLDPERRIWVEDESLSIGKKIIPPAFWKAMQGATVLNLQVPAEQRVELLTNEYGTLDKDFLIECTGRIYKRLGPEQTKHAVAAIREDRMSDFVRIVLVYYDKAYKRGLALREPAKIIDLSLPAVDPPANANYILQSWK